MNAPKRIETPLLRLSPETLRECREVASRSPFADSEKMTLAEPGSETGRYLADYYERKTFTGD